MAVIDPSAPRSLRFRVVVAGLSVGLAGVLAWAIIDLDDEPSGLTTQVQAQLDDSGVGHPVTAVLLNFRAYDTWLEVIVLFLAAAGILVLRQSSRINEPSEPVPDDPILTWLVRVLAPLAIVAGVYLLWLGTDAPGGAFQAGAVLGAAGVLLRLSGVRSIGLLSPPLLRSSLVAGVVAFLLVGAALVLLGQLLLEFPREWAGLLVIVIELLVTWSVATTFIVLFVAARPSPEEPSESEAAS
jgi:multisubunit Na+/H+ antiporter MnhB subunit